jgi:hypothetical protein
MYVESLLPSKFTGIIQLAVDVEFEPQLQALIDTLVSTDDRWVPVNKIHCTLLHQKYPKLHQSSDGLRGDKALKALFKSSYTAPSVTLKLGPVSHCHDTAAGRESLIAPVLNVDEVRSFRDEILSTAGLDPEQFVSSFDDDERNRMFHISLCNLTGNPGDSPAFPNSTNTSQYGV